MNVFRVQFSQRILTPPMQIIHWNLKPTTPDYHYARNVLSLHSANLLRRFCAFICFYFSQNTPNHQICLSFYLPSAACSYKYKLHKYKIIDRISISSNNAIQFLVINLS
jgi:hypothetical protein